jgi:hypothetical protein
MGVSGGLLVKSIGVCQNHLFAYMGVSVLSACLVGCVSRASLPIWVCQEAFLSRVYCRSVSELQAVCLDGSVSPVCQSLL